MHFEDFWFTDMALFDNVHLYPIVIIFCYRTEPKSDRAIHSELYSPLKPASNIGLFTRVSILDYSRIFQPIEHINPETITLKAASFTLMCHTQVHYIIPLSSSDLLIEHDCMDHMYIY